ncbi:MAG: DUF3300 domain-containing protein [Rhodobacteraceae bacterium]|nr:DUF3300 domain-containing protein [Paracoccaceae bacterium]
MKYLTLKTVILCSAMLVPSCLFAQSTTDTAASATTEDTSGLMTPEELQTLVGPVALYPDTLLIQVLVAATYPLEVMKADRLLKDNVDTTPEDLKPKIEAQGWDESVAVLATAFPDVLSEMAVHIDWTESIGDAMLAQSDDVMAAAQVMREKADEAGTLVSGDEQTVEVTQESNGDQTIIIQPTNPEVVYVPQYDSNTVYVQDNNNTGDAVAAGLILFSTFVVMDAIFDNNDPWHNYWGCHNCGGWNNQPIVYNPKNVNIDTGNINIGNDIGWNPDKERKQKAQKDISDRRGPDGATKMAIDRPDRGDEMRANLSRQSGAPDISRDSSPRAAVEKSRPSGGHNQAVARTGASGGNRNAVQKPKTARAPTQKPSARAPTQKPSARGGGAMNHRSSAPKAHSGGSRGRASAGGSRRK